MSVALRVTGTWAELVADGTVAIPATPQAGDRMYLFARWKDFSVTATVANWIGLVEFADGAVTAGNGTGSVKVACWYRDWQSGDTDPTIDFSAAPENASVVIIVMAKEPDDVWLTPVARTAAMTTWTTTPQSVSASATVDVPSSGVVMGLIGIRDDTATMTRPTDGIDDSGGLVTWNGNHVESPATHHSTTTGFDGAADLGYRLVTTGASGATLRLTGTISAAETGSALWVVQGVSVLVTPGNATLIGSQFAPQLKLGVTPASASLTTAHFAPQLRESMTPEQAALNITRFAPISALGITPPAIALAATSFAPQLREAVMPVTTSLNVVRFTPTLNTQLVPTSLSLTLGTFAPSVLQDVIITIPNAAFTLTTSQPHILPFRPVFLDPGGDAVQQLGWFNVDPGLTGLATFDSTQKVVGVGSWKCDSGTEGAIVAPRVSGVLGTSRRVSFQYRYSTVPDMSAVDTRFPLTETVYSGGGLENPSSTQTDNSIYATATPAQNAGQGSVLSGFAISLPLGAVIDSVKIIYERKYDTAGSIGISRVKWRVNGEEGPNHDNTDEPLTDTVVEVDVTLDRTWEIGDLVNGVFEVIAEARRGDTETAHTQSWDYVKVEVAFHTAVTIWQAEAGGLPAFGLALLPKGSHCVVRFVDGAGAAYDGIDQLVPNAFNRFGISYALNGTDDLDVRVYVNSIQELAIETASTAGGVPPFPDMRYGWLTSPGDNVNAWFDQIFIDDGDDLSDPGNVLITAKLPATVNNDNFDTTGGTGAVNERPVSLDNYRAQLATAQNSQDYTLQAAGVGDVDLTSKILLGHEGWLIAKRAGLNANFGFILNGNITNVQFPTAASFARLLVTTTSYPSNAAGIGLQSATSATDGFLYECGVVVAYEGPVHDDILLGNQQLNNETLNTIVDDLRTVLPDSYEVCCTFDDFDGEVAIVIHSLDQDGGSVQYQDTLRSKGRTRINPGVEVYLDVTVVGVTNLQIWRRLNVD